MGVVQACRERAFTFSIKFLWRVTNNTGHIVIPIWFQLYVLTVKFIGVQNQGDISFYYIDTSVLLENIPLVKFIKTTHKEPQWYIFHNLTREFIDDVILVIFLYYFIDVF